MEKHVLGLVLPTDPRWVNIAEKNIRDILIDHAYCEQKAASSCISLIILHPDRQSLVDKLTPVMWSSGLGSQFSSVDDIASESLDDVLDVLLILVVVVVQRETPGSKLVCRVHCKMKSGYSS
jgi:hypothetical protein